MKQQNLYNVTVVGSFTKDILVWAEDEDAALDFIQSICDNTDLIRFEGDELLEVTAEDVEEIDPFDGFETGDGGNSGDADNAAENRGEGCGSIRIVGSTDSGNPTNGEKANQRKVAEGCRCSGEACTSCGKCEKRRARKHNFSSAGEPISELVRLAAAVVLDHLLNAKDD